MALHVLRDYAAAAAGYFAPGGGVQYFYTPYIYNLSLFLNKVLGYSVVGQNVWDINSTNVQTFSNTATSAIAAGSNGQTLPQSTIFTANTTGFPNNGVIFVSASVSTTIAALSNGQVLPQSTINVASTAPFLANGTIQVVTTNGSQTVTYTGVNGTQFTGCTGGTGTMSTGNSVTSTAPQIVNYTGITVNAFLNCTGGTGTMTAGQATTTTAVQALPTATINVTSTAGFATSGTIYIVTTTGVQAVAYTGTSGGNQFTGCTGGTGSTSNGGSVTSAGGAVACSPLKVVSNTGTPSTLTLNFPHGMLNNQYVTVISTVTPWPINVTAINQLQLITTAANVGAAGSIVYPPGMLLASGTVLGGTGASINVPGANSVYAVSIPPNVRTPQSGAAPLNGDVGRILVLKSTNYPTKNSGLFKISAINTGNTTTIIAASNNQTLPQATINVSSTTGFPASGTIFVYTSTGVQTVTYTGGGGGGTTFTGCTGGTGTMNTGNTVDNFNGYTIDYRSSDTPPAGDTMDWWLYEIETQTSFYVGYPNNGGVSGLGLLSTTNTAPIQVNTNLNQHGDWRTGQTVTISGVTINTNANGTWTITVQSPTTTSGVFTLNGSVGNGTSGATGTVTRNGYTGGSNVSFNSKVILQSPHSTGWQVRLAVEPFNISFSPVTTVSVGYGGSSGGDWPVGGTHTHTAQFLDVNATNVAPGLAIESTLIGSANTNATAIRTTMIGDDTGQALFCYARSQGAGNNGLVTFGLPDNEPAPLQPNINRPFVYGGINISDFGNIQMRMGSTTNNFGLTYRDTNPEVCGIAGWVNLDGVSGSVPTYSANAGDSPFTGTTEVLPWEIWAGIATDPILNLPFNSNNGVPPWGLNQRFMGTAPFIRQGRTNFGTFTLSTDSTASSNVSAASATSPIQITTSATNALTTGQTVVISGVGGLTGANGTFIITVIDNTHFTLNGSTGTGTYTSGGTVVGTPHWLHLQNGIYLQWNGAGGLTP